MKIGTYEIYSLTSAILFAIGLGGVFLAKHFLRKIIATIIMGAGVFLCFVSFAKRDALTFADPIPHALVITGIVVAVTAAAFALSLARRIHKLTGEDTFGNEK
ncbi:NADH-quinone oxidoreductase subunit K [Cecembia lonarensis]|uniref:Putative monovalent cation/H+ antiporter subunit C n=1 Tax=Cecembia lonarensis (strain CCUG 58316 / KCTC 22772 / LW9) TaxID=1225176 RepID=K1LDG3_CECL9|nr:NADH-quinone oxidoreductase subunit K [Cecembia lonarensis]EKB50182.1 putative monovalent cation/H+ antiporter subunit C [Cecembia lonarensis LW9]